MSAIAQSIGLELQAIAGDAGSAGSVTVRVVSGSRFASINVEPSGDTRESMTLEVPQISQQVFYIWSGALTSRQLDVYVTWFDLPLLAG